MDSKAGVREAMTQKHQYSHYTLPQSFSTFLTLITSVHERFTGAKIEQKLDIPKFSTARSQISFEYQGARSQLK